MAVDERNFRSAYYEKVGFKNVEEKRSIEILLKEKQLDLQKLKQFCLRFGVPIAYKNYVWKLLLGVLPMNENCRDFVYEQRRQVYNNLKHALIQMCYINNDTIKIQRYVTMWLLEYGRLRPGVYDFEQTSRNLTAIVKFVMTLFNNDIDVYWIFRNFYDVVQKYQPEIPKLVDLTYNLLEKEDADLHKHLIKINILDDIPFKQWFEVCFAGVITDIVLGKIWDKICAGSYKILIYVAITILTTQNRKLSKCTKLEQVLNIITKLSNELSEVVVNKSLELWQQHGSPLTVYDKPKPQ